MRIVALLRHTQRTKAAASDAVDVAERGEAWREVVEDVSGIAQAGEQHERPPSATPVEYFERHLAIDVHHRCAMWRWVTPFGNGRRLLVWLGCSIGGRRCTFCRECSGVARRELDVSGERIRTGDRPSEQYCSGSARRSGEGEGDFDSVSRNSSFDLVVAKGPRRIIPR